MAKWAFTQLHVPKDGYILGQHRAIAQTRHEVSDQRKKADDAPAFFSRRRTESNCQVGPVSQNQICQRKHDVEFCFLFLKPSVSRLS